MAAVLKTAMGLHPSWVRIPRPPRRLRCSERCETLLNTSWSRPWSRSSAGADVTDTVGRRGSVRKDAARGSWYVIADVAEVGALQRKQVRRGGVATRRG